MAGVRSIYSLKLHVRRTKGMRLAYISSVHITCTYHTGAVGAGVGRWFWIEGLT